eukprot:TRINITY_DN3580_c0_g1_i8.p1 TRINITY_DN3580_c0_g1~~TRINITY_DN3580_c0_g1_i8.p1  ORF type:complete len:176 (+),score=31.71 TRINITY_DN3580_c0_g1_i8:111-638(+)
MRRMDEVASQQHELSETLKQHVARISAILEEPEATPQQGPTTMAALRLRQDRAQTEAAGAIIIPADISREEEANWWRERIAKLAESAPPLEEPHCPSVCAPRNSEDLVRSGDACMVVRPPRSPCTPRQGRGRRPAAHSGRNFMPLAAASMPDIDKREGQCFRDKSLDRMTEVPSC